MRSGEPGQQSWLTTPFLPRNGSHEIMRMMLEVQNGTVHSRNNPICQQHAADMEDQEIGER